MVIYASGKTTLPVHALYYWRKGTDTVKIRVCTFSRFMLFFQVLHVYLWDVYLTIVYITRQWSSISKTGWLMAEIVTWFQVWWWAVFIFMMNFVYIFLVLSNNTTRAAEQDTLTQLSVVLVSNRCVVQYSIDFCLIFWW